MTRPSDCRPQPTIVLSCPLPSPAYASSRGATSSVVQRTYGRAARTWSATPCSAHHCGELTSGSPLTRRYESDPPKSVPMGRGYRRRPKVSQWEDPQPKSVPVGRAASVSTIGGTQPPTGQLGGCPQFCHPATPT